MKNLTYLFSAFLILLLSGCETVVDLELEQSEPRLSVEAIVTDQQDLNYVKLAMSGPYGKNTETLPVRDAQVNLTDNTGEKITFTHQENGLYKPASTFKGIANRLYTLTIIANGQTYTASSLLPEVPQVDTVGYRYVETKTDPFSRKDGYYLSLAFQDAPEVNNYYKIDLIRNGKLLQKDASDILVTDDRLFNGAHVMDEVNTTFSQGDEVTLNLLSLTKEACEYYRAISALQGQGGLFGRNPANLPTNISNGAVGFFSASAVSGKTVQIK
ncbi:DUF4249 domain-containing protein [Adhaeribacter sp. BT258]|uniref:DUF4249 domain-containing protein n=2 Tax=Adhaeribacter terrigena TaxID=2793070 RepID=A0ABS1C073_9BACT|nr:DUF4249 domain-containing protein [Adhaeribacter terrigena]